jgi:hypothetical protein
MDDPYVWLAHWAGRWAAREGDKFRCPFRDRLLAIAWKRGYQTEYFHPFIQELEGIDVH